MIRIRRIEIELEVKVDNEHDIEANHATTMIYEDKKWVVNGTLFPRFLALMLSLSKEN